MNSTEKEEISESVRAVMKKFKRDMTHLEQAYQTYQAATSDQTPIPKDHFSLFIEWALHMHEYFDEDLHSGPVDEKFVLNNKTCHKASTRDQFFKSFSPEFLNNFWPMRFTRKFLKKLGNVKTEKLQMDILDIMQSFGKGRFLSYTLVPVQGLSYMVFFKSRLPGCNLALVVSVHLERYPEFDKYKKVKAFRYLHVVRFLDILNENDKVTALNACLSFLEDCKKDPARQDCQPKLIQEKTIPNYQVTQQTDWPCFEKKNYLKGDAIVLSPLISEQKKSAEVYYTFLPNLFETDYLTPEEVEDLIYDKDIIRWVSKKAYSIFLRRQENALISKINSEVLEKFADFESSARLVNLLEKMKNLKLKLTSEEKRLIGQSGNVLAIGRSGTGKTTCCVLRLFSQEMLYKIRLAQAQVKHGVLRDARYMADQLENLIGVHSVFVTASPVLTNEVQRYYQNLSRRIRDEIKEREEKHKEKEKAEQSSGLNETKGKEESEIISEITYEKVDENETEKEETKVADEKEKEDAFNEEDYLMDEEEAETQAKFSKNYCFDNIEDKDFPLFLTIKRIVLMIDGTLQKPFFARKKDNSIIGSDTQAQWHNEVKGLMMISDKYRGMNEDEDDDAEIASPVDKITSIHEKDNMIQEEEEEDEEEETTVMKIDDSDIEAEYERYQAILKKRKDQFEHEQEMRKKNKMSFEVDYDYFYNHFWLRVYSRTYKVSKVSPILVWSEIISTIKGSAESHLYPGFYLPIEVYLSLAIEGSTLLNSENRRAIYKHFIDYEEWKMKESGYDFMDVVNHSLNEIRLKGYNGVPIHFIMIDEVQDLSHATILLLMKITEQSVFFAGDTAQTIAKGVGVRFSDLSSLFKLTPEKEYLWKRPTVHQLTVNFRSHSKILDMANSVVTLVETFFPKTIDKLKKEKSEIDGPKPILLEDVDLEVLFAVLFGNENFKSHRHSQNQGGALEKPPIEFGCNQAIIVRDQESKNKLPPLLKHALCLTVYEAKGLEFDDVILYNFFSESSVSQKEWELLSYLDIESRTLDKDTFNQYYFTYKEEELADLNIEQTRKQTMEGEKDKNEIDLFAPDLFNFELEANKYTFKRVSLPKRLYSIIDLESYGTLCNELKQLYVALTRPRNRIIIYDDNIEKREEIEKYWKQLSLVQVVNKKALENKKVDPNTDEDLESFKSLLVSTSKSDWKKQGLRMFRNKYYEQAVKCFEKAEDEKLMRRAQGYLIAERASNKLKQISNEQNMISKDLNKAKEAEVKEKRTQTKQLRREAKTCYEDYEKAANMFYELDLLKQASQCFFSAGNYHKALEIYEKLGMLREAGEACLMLRLYEKAADLFSRGGDVIRTIECLDLIKDYDKILDILQNAKDLPTEQKKYFGRKYVPLALLKLTENIEFKEHENVPENDGGIQEEEEEEEEKEATHETVLTKGKSDTGEIKELTDQTQDKVESRKDVKDMSFDVIDKSDQGKDLSFVEIRSNEIQRNLSGMSFENIEDSVENFDHLSQFDLRDEFLKSESGSIIDSISAHRKDKSMTSSDFSAVEFNYLMNAQYQLVQTKADIFIQDSIMEKIIKYINMFSDDFKENFQKLRSKDVLLTQDAEGEGKTTSVHAMSQNLIDLDNISLDFVYLILDFLEQSKLFKLCIFVCNRYKLANKLGRYLVNMAFKYSNLPAEDIRANFFKLFLARNRQIQQEKAFVANTAVHNILEIINPNYLKLKKKGEQVDDTNSLGDSCYSSLISLGFWKKCLFLMDYKNSLALASTFASFKNYKLIFLKSSDAYNIPQENIQALVEEEGFDFLPFETPNSSQEVKAAIAGLESVVWDLTEKLPSHLYKQYKPEVRNMREVRVSKFPSYFSYNASLWEFLVNKKKDEFIEHIQRASKSLDNLLKSPASYLTKVEMFDVVSFLVQISLFYSSNQTVTDLVNRLEIFDFANLVFALKQIVEYSLSVHAINEHQEIIMKALLSSLRIRFIERSSVLKEISLHNYLVHISSPIIADIVAAENSASPGLIYDIEGNFILVSINLGLKEIRKKMASIFKHFVNVQAKLHSTTHKSNASLKAHIEAKSQILGLIHAHNYCKGFPQDPVKKNSEAKKTNGTSKTKGKQEMIQLDEQERKDLEEEVYEGLIANFQENRTTIKPNLKSQTVQQFKVTNVINNAKKEDDESLLTSFHLLKTNIFKELKKLLAVYADFKLDIGYYSRSELLNFGLKKLSKYVQQKKLKTWIVHLFYVIDKHVILNEFLRKHKKNPIAEKLQCYSDAIYYRTFFCSEEYADNAFQFISLSYNKMSLTDAIATLKGLISYAIIADSLAQGHTQVALSASLLPSIGLQANKDTEKILKTNIVPLADREYLREILHWISKVVERVAHEGLSSQICLRVLKLLLNIFANAQNLDGDTIRTLTGSIELLLDANPFQDYITNARSRRKNTEEGESDEIKNQFLQNVLNAFHELDVLDENGLEGLVGFYKVQGFVTVDIESDAEMAQLNAEKCEKAWLLDSRTIAQRITLRRKLKRLFLKKRANKLRENALQSMINQKTNYLLELLDASSVRELKKYLLLPDLRLDIFEYINDSVRRMWTYYGKTSLQSPIDFHYISNLIQKMIGCGLEYVRVLKEGLKSKEIRKKTDFQETHRENAEKVETLIKEFEKWCLNKESQEKGEEKFAKRKKLVSAKWEEEALLTKMQQIAKKRKGLIKQIKQTKVRSRTETFKKKVGAERMQAALMRKARDFKGTA